MNELLTYLKGFHSIAPEGPHRAYYAWQVSQAKLVSVSSYKDNPELNKLVTRFLQGFKPKLRDCYTTAYHAAVDIPGVEYVAGIAGSIIPLDHGWNCYKGVYFDLTAEVLFDKGHFAKEYLQILKLDTQDVFAMSLISEDSGPYLSEYYRTKVLGEKVRRRRG